MSIIIKSGSGSELMTVDPISLAARITIYDAQGNPIQVQNKNVLSSTQKAQMSMGSDGTNGRFLRTDRFGQLSINNPNLAWYDSAEGVAVNTVIWTQSLTTQTMTQANESILFNASAITTLATGSMLVSTKQFFKKPRVPLVVRFTKVLLNHVNNSVIELGFGSSASAVTATPIINGAFMRKDTDGSVYLVVSSNGTETLSLPQTSPNTTSYYTIEIMLMDDKATLVVFDSVNAPIIDVTLSLPVATQALWSVSHLPIYARTYNNTAPASPTTLRISTTSVFELDFADTKPYPHKMAALGKHLWNNPFTAFNQLANYTNNTAPILRTPSNTVAGETTLGGQISWANGANSFGASDTLDLILFGYQNVTPYQMCITDISIGTINLGAANGANEYTIQYFIAINGSAISLATASYSRQTLGFQNLSATSAIGSRFLDRISENYQTPIVVEAGRFFVIGARILSGSVSAGQIIRTMANLKGYFE